MIENEGWRSLVFGGSTCSSPRPCAGVYQAAREQQEAPGARVLHSGPRHEAGVTKGGGASERGRSGGALGGPDRFQARRAVVAAKRRAKTSRRGLGWNRAS